MINIKRALASRPRFWRIFTTLVLVGFTIVFLGYLLYREWDVLISYPWQLRWLPLLVSFVLYAAGQWLAALVWVWIVRTLGAQLSFFRHLGYYYISRLARRLPGTVWYVAYLAQMYKNEGFSARLTSLASVIELVVTILSGILVSLLFAIETLARNPLGILGTTVLAAASLAFLHPSLIGWLLHRFGSQSEPPAYPSLLKWIGVYIIIRLLSGGIVFAAINVIYPLPLDNLPYIIGIWSVVGVLSNLLILSPSNFGFTEVSLSLLLSTIMPSSIAVIIAVGLRILFIFFDLVGAIVAQRFTSIPDRQS